MLDFMLNYTSAGLYIILDHCCQLNFPSVVKNIELNEGFQVVFT